MAQDTKSSVQSLLSKIGAIQAVNQEIIQRLKAQPVDNKRTIQYVVEYTEPKPDGVRLLRVKEQECTLPVVLIAAVASILSNWKCKSQFEELPDLFGKINHTVTTWDELIGLVEAMSRVVGKFAFFDDSQRTVDALQKFKTNFETSQICLGSLESCFASPVSQIQEYQEHVDKINEEILNLSKKQHVVFSWSAEESFIDFEWDQQGQSYVQIDGKTVASLTAGCVSILAKTPLPNAGKFSWKTRVDAIGSFFSIGVVAAGYTPNGYIGNSTNGWSINEDGRCENNATFEPLLDRFKEGDVVISTVDRDAGAISWMLESDKECRTAFSNLPRGILYPAVMVGGTSALSLAN